MSLSGIVRRRDRQPLGSPEQVKTQLSGAFPGTRFLLIRAEDDIGPAHFRRRRFGLAPLLLWLWEPRYPRWKGHFQGNEYAATFELDAGPIVKKVEFTLYGQGANPADVHFATLVEQTGWQIKLPRF
jgi:hypothetical protein